MLVVMHSHASPEQIDQVLDAIVKAVPEGKADKPAHAGAN